MDDKVILTAKERLQRLAEYLNMSVRGLAQFAEMSEATLYHITDQTRDMTGRTAARLCYQIERKRGALVNRDWLLTGRGKMLLNIPSVEPVEESESLPVAADSKEEVVFEQTDWKEKYYALLEKYTALLEERNK